MKIGFVVLAHDNIFRLRQVVRFLASGGAPVALHLDQKASKAIREMLIYNFSDLDNVFFVDPVACGWGDWSLVEATIRGTQLLMKKHPDLDYIMNLSGSCLPIKSVSEMERFLSNQPEQIDYIECFSPNEKAWIKSGLTHERTTLFHPFNWRNARRAFDLNVKIQRLFKVNRKPPENIEISFGSQWWCLSTETLSSIFSSSRFEEFTRFFKKTWIPDESFFQTLVGHFSKHISGKSLTYVNFDHTGKPFIFYDDHFDTLNKLDRFFVRKAWFGADKLYSHFLNPFRKIQTKTERAEDKLTASLEEAKFRATQSRKGLISQFRFPVKKNILETSQPYQILIGMEAFRADLTALYKNCEHTKLMGHIFKRNQIQENPSSDKSSDANMPLWRDYSPAQFLMQKIWYAQPKKLAFFSNAFQIKRITKKIAADENCEIYMVEGAFLLQFAQRNISNIRRLKALCQIELKRERFLISEFKGPNSKASLNTIPIGSILDNAQLLKIKDIGDVSLSVPTELIQKIRNLSEQLKSSGINLDHLNISPEPQPELGPNVIDLKAYKKSS